MISVVSGIRNALDLLDLSVLQLRSGWTTAEGYGFGFLTALRRTGSFNCG